MPDDISLREYLDARLGDLQAHVDASIESRSQWSHDMLLQLQKSLDDRFQLNAQAAQEASKQLDQRVASLNEFRQILTDQQRTFVSREVLDSVTDSITKRTNDNADRIAKLEGRMLGGAAAVTFVLMIMEALLHFLK
jgi:two-component sensor histidine kinase